MGGNRGEQVEDHLDYDLPASVAVWRLVGPAGEMRRAVADVGLDGNALRPADLDEEATVEYPSAFCTDGAVFLGILALLNQRTAPLRLYRSVERPDGGDRYLVRVFPEPGEETQAVLRAFHPAVARQVGELQERIRWAFDHLAAS
ncbi:hypothetical protein [Caenispirillum bisanense]|uniref:Uncharacterized protein n=1 Tax=Caenispirillum bisanense TaxID=414052 RepID=A0A286GTD6_9PROT|nr:hypothetical protein [Caenispirillum bisanense]SOD98803.1 hypothetical protein SAMN05421508_10890 [Caenispirillum bisanense]